MHTWHFILSNPLVFYGIALCFGLLVGSFLNVVIYRLPKMMDREWHAQCYEFLNLQDKLDTLQAEPPFNLVKPDSTCPKCGHKIRFYENIPVISYLFLRGKCSNCKTIISARYPVIEAITGLLAMLVAMHFGPSWQSAAGLIFVFCLVSLTMIDYDTQLLPDQITLPLMWLGLVLNYFNVFTDLPSALWGAIAGYLSLWSIYWLFKLATGKEGMGYGDFKLLAALGAWMGWSYLPIIILLSSCVGAVVGISLMLFNVIKREQPIPFGPYLAGAGLIAFIWGDKLMPLFFL